MALLLDRIDAERDAQQDDGDPHDRRRANTCVALVCHVDTKTTPSEIDTRSTAVRIQSCNRRRSTASSGGRAEITEAGHPGLPLDPLAHLLIRRHDIGLLQASDVRGGPVEQKNGKGSDPGG